MDTTGSRRSSQAGEVPDGGEPAGSSVRTAVVDAALAAGIGAGVALGPLLFTGERTSPATDALGAVVAAALFLRRARPYVVCAVVVAAAAVYAAIGERPTPAAVAAGVALLAVGERAEWWGALTASALALVAVLVPYIVRALGEPGALGDVWGVSAVIGVVLLLPGTLPSAVRLRRRSVERAGAEELRRRVAEERLGIAREVHDVVGHALAVISMQSGVALHVSAKRPEQAVEALEAIRQVSREALVELDMTFGVFRETPAGAELGLDHLDELVATMRRAGVEVELRVRGERVPLRPEVERAAYRIVQESLTNVLHHADSESATVEIGYEPRALLVQVCNHGAPPGREPRLRESRGRGSGGHGIVGMKERTAALGGLLEAEPLEGGGFLVTARLPRAG